MSARISLVLAHFSTSAQYNLPYNDYEIVIVIQFFYLDAIFRIRTEKIRHSQLVGIKWTWLASFVQLKREIKTATVWRNKKIYERFSQMFVCSQYYKLGCARNIILAQILCALSCICSKENYENLYARVESKSASTNESPALNFLH